MTNARQGVVRDAFLKEVVLALQRDPLHPRKRIGRVPDFGVAQSHHETIGHELNVLGHSRSRHSNKSTRQCLRDELLLSLDGLPHELNGLRLRQPVLALGIQKAREVRVESLVAGDEFVGSRETRHDSPLFEPEDRTERSTEEDALNDSKRHEPRGKIRLLTGYPRQCPLRLLLDARHGLNRLENRGFFGTILNVRVDEERIGFAVDGLHHHLYSVEEARLR